MNPADFPEWVPASVKSMAAAFEVGGVVRERLLTNSKMKKVWNVILTSEVNEAYLNSLQGYRRLADFEISERGLSLQDRAAASFYSYAVSEMSMYRSVLTQTKINDTVNRWLDAATVCTEIWSYDYKPLSDEKLAASLALVSEHLQECAHRFSLEREANPLVIDKSSGLRGDDEIRMRVRIIADEVHRLFGGRHLRNTVGTVVSVALAIDAISEKNVENWCKNLPAQRNGSPPIRNM